MSLRTNQKKNLLVTLLSGLVAFSLIGLAFFWMYSPVGHIKGNSSIINSDEQFKKPIVFTQNLNKELLKICQHEDDNIYVASYNQDVRSGPNFAKPKMKNIQGEYKVNIQIQENLTYNNKCLLKEEKLSQVNAAFTKAVKTIGGNPASIHFNSRTDGSLFNAIAEFEDNNEFYSLSIQKDNIIFLASDKLFDPRKVEYVSSTKIPKTFNEDKKLTIEEFSSLK